MPISIDEFTEGEVPDGPSVPERVVAFLAANDRQAFTRSEIARDRRRPKHRRDGALSTEGARIGSPSGNYWAITEDRERLHSAYQLYREGVALDEEDGGIDPDEWDEHTPMDCI